MIALPIDDATWALVAGSGGKPGDAADVAVDIELVGTGAYGSEVVFDRTEVVGIVDPKNDPAAAGKNDDGDA